jgi:hypothetical protein
MTAPRRNARDPEQALIEATLGAHRDRDPDGNARPSSAWADLSVEGRVKAFHAQSEMRAIECALDPDGWDSTVKAVLERLR